MDKLPPLPPMPISDRLDRNRLLAGGSDMIPAWDDDMWMTRWAMAKGGGVVKTWTAMIEGELILNGRGDFKA